MTGKRIAIVQSNYLPWKGYFDLIASVDEFVLFDDFQYTRRSWRNRNLIKTPQGVQWLTVPVIASPQRSTRISEVKIAELGWGEHHLKTLRMAYGRAPFFSEVIALVEEAIGACPSHLSELNEFLVRRICAYLGIRTPISTHRDYSGTDDRQLRLRDICVQAGASIYVSGPAAKCYLDEEVMRSAGIAVEWFDYAGYPEYRQLWGPFVHEVSIVDLLFNQGPYSADYLRFAPGSNRLGLEGSRPQAQKEERPLLVDELAA